MSEHSRDYVLEIYEYLDSLETHHAYLVHRDGVPVALLQTYEPAADPVGDCYDVQPGDIGAHLLLGPAEAYEPGFTACLFRAFVSYLLGDPANQRIVVEPDARNAKAVARLERTGFVMGPEIELPDKRAVGLPDPLVVRRFRLGPRAACVPTKVSRLTSKRLTSTTRAKVGQHVCTGTAPDEEGLHGRRGDDERTTVGGLRQR